MFSILGPLFDKTEAPLLSLAVECMAFAGHVSLHTT